MTMGPPPVDQVKAAEDAVKPMMKLAEKMREDRERHCMEAILEPDPRQGRLVPFVDLTGVPAKYAPPEWRRLRISTACKEALALLEDEFPPPMEPQEIGEGSTGPRKRKPRFCRHCGKRARGGRCWGCWLFGPRQPLFGDGYRPRADWPPPETGRGRFANGSSPPRVRRATSSIRRGEHGPVGPVERMDAPCQSSGGLRPWVERCAFAST